MESARLGTVAAVVVALCGCAGGGGGGGGGGNGAIVLEPAAVSFVAVVNSPAPEPELLRVSWTSAEVTKIIVQWPASATWLGVGDLTCAGKTCTVPLSASGTATPPTTLSSFVRVTLERSDASVIAVANAPVTFDIRSFGVMPKSVSSTFVLGSDGAPPRTAAVHTWQWGMPWTASADRTWIHLGATSGTTPSDYSQTGSPVTISFDATGLAMGTHAGTVTFVVGGGGSTATLPVTLRVVGPTLTAAPFPLALGLPSGHDLAPSPLLVSLDTGGNAHPWTATTFDAWLELAATSATTSSTPATLLVSPAPVARSWPAGVYDASITLTANVDGIVLTTTVPVAYYLDDLRLHVSEEGVALTATPSASLLSRSIIVSSNRGIPAAWDAASDRSWLTVTGHGTTGDPLVLTADPTGLPTDALHEARVTVTTSDPAFAHTTETVRVGFWIGTTLLDVATAAVPVVASERALAIDPVRPHAYLVYGTEDVLVLNVHTGVLERTISVPGAALRALAPSTDGARLYAVDGATNRVVPIDLATGVAGSGWTIPSREYSWYDPSTAGIAFARPNGVPALFTTGGTAHDPETGASYGTYTDIYGTSAIAASRDGARVCTVALGTSPSYVQCFRVEASLVSGYDPWLTSVAGAYGSIGSNGQDVAVSRDGLRAAAASGAPYAFTLFEPATRSLASATSLGAAPYPSAVDFAWDGRIFGGLQASYGEPGLWAWGADGTPLGTWDVGGVAARMVRASGDGLRAVLVTGADFKSVRTGP